MRSYLDCIPCFYHQALRATRISGANEDIQREVLNCLSELIPSFSLDTTPPEMGREIYAMVSRVTGKKDPYKEIKEEGNKTALKIYPQMKSMVKDAADPLLTAIRLAIVGNIIDFGIQDNDKELIDDELARLLHHDFDSMVTDNSDHFNYASFKQHLSEVDSVLYLADNAGEVVFDRILIEHLVNDYHKTVIYVVKGKPALNDALVDDAIFCGINQFANIISCGADAPGVLLKYCAPEFIRIFNDAQMIISKGQGNYEALSDGTNPVFFLLIAKCPVIASHLECAIGDFILEDGSRKKSIAVPMTVTTDKISHEE